MFKTDQQPLQLTHQDQVLPETFSLLIWNVHKENLNLSFQNHLKYLAKKYASDILMFQEYKLKKSVQDHTDYSYAMACNMETLRYLYGVFTATKNHFKDVTCHTTQSQELFFITHKSLLITQHLLSDGTPLTLVNIHAINFVRLRSFQKELNIITEALAQIKGAMIVCGDFNSWSQKRMSALQEAQQHLHLQQASLQQEHHVKQIFNKPIDHLFYRGLILQEAQVINTQKISDHNPLWARFRVDASSKTLQSKL